MRLLVIGGSGFIGSSIVSRAIDKGFEVAYSFCSKPLNLTTKSYFLDFTDVTTKGNLEQIIDEFQPEIIIYSAVAPTQGDFTLQEAINVIGAANVISLVRKIQTKPLFIYMSTDAIFGEGRGRYTEVDEPTPESRNDPYRIYGITRAAGEKVVLQEWPNSLIVRTAWVNGITMEGNLSSRLLDLAERFESNQPFKRFGDMFLSPTLLDNLTDALFELFRSDFKYRGVLHLSGSERTTPFDFTCQVARYLGYDENLIKENSRLDSPAMRNGPKDTSLNVSFTQSLLKTRLLGINEQLTQIFPTPNPKAKE